jgi:hypothetical protein
LTEADETRFKIIKEMIMEFPELREKVLKWLQKSRKEQS